MAQSVAGQSEIAVPGFLPASFSPALGSTRPSQGFSPPQPEKWPSFLEHRFEHKCSRTDGGVTTGVGPESGGRGEERGATLGGGGGGGRRADVFMNERLVSEDIPGRKHY